MKMTGRVQYADMWDEILNANYLGKLHECFISVT